MGEKKEEKVVKRAWEWQVPASPYKEIKRDHDLLPFLGALGLFVLSLWSAGALTISILPVCLTLLSPVVWVFLTALRNVTFRRSIAMHQNEMNAIIDMHNKILKGVFDWDPCACEPKTRFDEIAKVSECHFAKAAKYWASRPFEQKYSLEDNIRRTAPAFMQFATESELRGLDAFLIAIPGPEHWETVEIFGQTVRRALSALAQTDPSGRNCMEKQDAIGTRRWRFTYDRQSFFITTFAPCYSSSSSRYTFNEKDYCFILFQPDHSFLTHNIGPETGASETRWEDPVTIRDRIRKEFLRNGRSYFIPETPYYPTAEHIVKPLKLSEPVVEWWVPSNK